MPTKKNSFLIDKEKFEKAKKINDPKKFKVYLRELLNLANQHYNVVHLIYKNNPDIEKFNFCKQNFSRIKSIIELKEKSLLNTPLYLEAWMSMLYSEVHALNLEPKKIEELSEVIKTIQTIGTSFKQLLIIKLCLDSSNENSARLLKYIDAFEQTWKTKEKRLLADIYFNFAEILVENSDFEGAINYFTESMRLYKNAAENTENKLEKNQLLEFASQTNSRIEEVKKIISQNMLSKSNHANDQIEKFTLHFKKLPDSTSKWTIINKAASQSIKKAIEIKGKRKLNNEPFQFKATKQKITLWVIEREKILEKFHTLEIDTDLDKIKLNIGSIGKRKAIAHNNYALFLIENLNNIKKSYSHSEKITFLTKTIVLLTKSAEIYKNINFTEGKNNVEHCINTIRSSLKNLDANINQITKPEDSPPIKTQASRSKSIRSISEKKLRDYQPILSIRLAYKFFNASLSENNTQIPILKIKKTPHV